MAMIHWSKAQEEAIEARGKHVLVSAAAGSGKTAVLVERVIRRLTRREDPLDIDRLVVVTFTRAAAAQMKSKIYQALREALQENPDNAYVRQQMMKVPNARICTIDALCGEIVRDHFQDVELDPGFRMADEAELRMLQSDVLAAVLEERYQTKDADFLRLAEYYTDRNDRKLEEIVLTLYQYAQSHPEPEVWLRGTVVPYQRAETDHTELEGLEYPEGMEDSLPEFARLVREQQAQIRDMAESGLRISRMEKGPQPFETRFRQLLELMDEMDQECLDNRRAMIGECLESWQRAPSVSTKDGAFDETFKNIASDYYKTIKEKLKQLRDQFLYADLEELYRDMAACLPVARAIRDLTLSFSEALCKEKQERKIADFSDIAHYALRVLIRYGEQGEILRDQNGTPLYTETADQMAREISEVIVDEYQDTNMLQEYLMNALSAQRFGRPNLFMVGDVKQSIYGFRMACPELFQKKSKAFHGSAGHLVSLDQNFRSRPEVLALTNRVFEQAMTEAVGGTEYREGHALRYGGDRNEAAETDGDYVPEILMIQGGGEQAKQQEAYRIVSRIERLVSEEGYHFSDIVILTRSSDNPQLEKILYQRGIPVAKNTGKGFFDSFEVRLALDLLKVIDNPLQDIPLAAVLYSPLCGASARDLARIRLAGSRDASLYDCLVRYRESDRFDWLLERLPVWQDEASCTGICEFLTYILEDSGLNRIVAAMPQGEDRRANLEFLKTRAEAFARSSYVGLFQFLRYVRELQKNDFDYGTAAAAAGAEVVRIMTIHRSKGLEFPVVILAGSGKSYNESDIRANIIPHRTLGLGIEYRDTVKKLIRKTMLMQTIRQKQKEETYGEEMRLLYVAMTRAKEKLIITGTERYLESAVRKWEEGERIGQEGLSSREILGANSYLKLLGLTLHRFRNQKDLVRLEYAEPQEAELERAEELLQNQALQDEIRNLAEQDGDLAEVAQQCLYQYPYENAARIQGKITASSLERRESEGGAVMNSFRKQSEAPLSEEEQEVLAGKERGNAYHTFLEHLDYEDPDIPGQLRKLSERGLLSSAACASIDVDKIRSFLASPIGTRMARAFREGKLVREQPFVMGYVSDVNAEKTLTGPGKVSDIPDPELLLVQGIIDAWFVESSVPVCSGSSPDSGTDAPLPGTDQQIVLVDYKTDHVTEEAYYQRTYYRQLKAYADALERSTGLPVAQMLIYSLELEKEILLEEEEHDHT